ncbi:splicing regulator SDE2-like [Anopheles bellator]|uniref:splicing regulator SDE2-like n=1 Tax=Anopheles bellator TaxID=139047 RepID=UPI002648D7B6|nr:splicing regulator SDE2-like [Anopheles bellator]
MYTLRYGRESLQVHVSPNAVEEVAAAITAWKGLSPKDYYITQNGRTIASWKTVFSSAPLCINDRLLGGKGGFGSMLRAIGAQIEKTTNREACRDLSGRRLRDINEEKRLKAYLEKQQEASEDKRAKIEKKIAKMLAKSKPEFDDEQYEAARSELVVAVDEALDKGLQQSAVAKSLVEEEGPSGTSRSRPVTAKRKRPTSIRDCSKRTRTEVWLGAERLSSGSESDS